MEWNVVRDALAQDLEGGDDSRPRARRVVARRRGGATRARGSPRARARERMEPTPRVPVARQARERTERATPPDATPAPPSILRRRTRAAPRVPKRPTPLTRRGCVRSSALLATDRRRGATGGRARALSRRATLKRQFTFSKLFDWLVMRANMAFDAGRQPGQGTGGAKEPRYIGGAWNAMSCNVMSCHARGKSRATSAVRARAFGERE